MGEQELFEEYKLYFGDDDVVCYWKENAFELNVQVENGTVYRYSALSHGVRKVPPNIEERMLNDEEYFRFIFSLNLDRLMSEAGMTRYALADIAGVSYASLTQYLNQNMSPSVYVLYKLRAALKCDISEFFRP